MSAPARAGVPVVYDAAVSFEAFADHPGHVSARVPVTLSFHAIKTFSTVEGVPCSGTIRRARRR